MAGAYGNPNLVPIKRTSFITFAGTAENVPLLPFTQAVTLFATADCWVAWGPAAVAAAPSGEKVFVQNARFIPASTERTCFVPAGTDAAPTLLSVIQSTAGGSLYIDEHSE